MIPESSYIFFFYFCSKFSNDTLFIVVMFEMKRAKDDKGNKGAAVSKRNQL